MSDRDANSRGGAAAGATEDDRGRLTPQDNASDAPAEADPTEERDRRVGDVIRRKQQQRARTAIQSELATDDVVRPRPEDPGPLEDAIIEMERVSLAFDRPILEDVSFAAFPGETLVIVGESGTGKSTALKLILRLLQPDEGRVYVHGQDIADLSFTEALAVRQKMGMVFQSAALFDSMTVFENVAYPLREHTDLTDDEIEARVREKLQFVDLDPENVMEKLPAELSGGMKKRVGIARGMANNAEIMLYDEPTSGLDPLTTATITRLIIKLQRELNVTSIVVSHDIRSSFRMATHIALLADRSIRFIGTPEEMAASDDRYIRDFLGGF